MSSAVVLGLFLATATATAVDPVVDVPGYEAITSSHEARGDHDAFVRTLAEVVAKDPASDAAALALLRLQDVRGQATDAAAVLVPALEKALAAKMPDARARDRAANLLGSLYAEAGDWEKARATVARRGVIHDWLVIGPFGFTTRAVHDRAFAVETQQRAAKLDVNEAFDGSAGRVGWRGVALGPLEDGLVPGEHMQPEDGCAYALAQLRAPSGTAAVLTVTCRGSFKAWWNGTLVADFDRSEGYHPDRVQVDVTFGEGWNRLLVKDTQARSDGSATIVAADGSGLIPGLEVEGGGRIHPRDASLGSASRRSYLHFLDKPLDRAAHALMLADAGLRTEALPLLASAAAGEPRSAHLAWFYAQVLEAAEHLPQARRANDARAQVLAALERDPKFLPALERRARHRDDDGKPEEALKALRALAESHPLSPDVLASAALIARRQGWDAEALEALGALVKLRPRSTAPLLHLADYYSKKDNRARSLELYKQALALDASSTWVADRVAGASLQMGQAGAAEEIARALMARYPGDTSPLRLLAKVHRAKGEPEKAAELFARAADIRGGDPDDYEEAAEVLIEAGRQQDAVGHLERALAAEPGRFRLRQLLSRIAGEDRGAEFAKEYDVDVLAGLAQAPGHDRYPKAHTICLLDQTVSRVHRDGSKVDYVHQAFKILDDAGVQRYHTLNLPGEVLELRTIATDGKTYEPIITDNTSEILMPKLEPGAVIEYRYRSVDGRRPSFQFNSGTFYFKDPNLGEPFERSQYVVIVDKGFDFETIQRNMPQVPVVTDRGETIVYAWDVRQSDRVDEERWMPEKDELLPLVELVQRRSWDDLSEVYRERFMGRTRLTHELTDKAAQVTNDVEGDAAKARKLYDFALDHVRADFGGSDAAEILVERAGSRMLLLRALLDAAGVPSRFAICGENPELSESVVWDPPRPDLLKNSALVIEPRDGQAVWVFDGGRFLPYGMVPGQAQGAPAMLLGPGGGEMRIVPEAPLDATSTLISVSVRLKGRDAAVSGKTTIREAGAYQFKERVVTATRVQLENFVEAQIGQVFRGASLKSFDFASLEEPGVPLTIAFEADVANHVQLQGERRTVRTGLAPLELTRLFGGRPQRVHPMLVRMERAQHDTIEIDLGESFEIESLPPNLLLKDEFAQYSLTFSVEDGKVRVVRSFAILPARVEPAEYGSVLRFCREVDATEKKWIELRERQGE